MITPIRILNFLVFFLSIIPFALSQSEEPSLGFEDK